MKTKKIRNILIFSLVVIVITIIISYIVESRSHKLPAVVRSDKVFVSSEVDGVMKEYFVSSMQEVVKKDPIAELENDKLPFKLETLKNEKRKYEELIHSAQSGDHLQSELYELDEDIQDITIDLEKAKLEMAKIKEKLQFMQDRHDGSKKKFEANKKLYDKGVLNNSDFEKATEDFWDVHDKYYELRSDSLVAFETMKANQKIIELLQARKDILSNNTNILAGKYLIDLNDVEADINDLEEEIKNLKIDSPIAGIVTDINYRPGENIDKGDVIVEIADLSNVWIIAYGTSSSRHKVQIGQKARILCGRKKKIWGKVVTISPVMEKVKSLSSSFETVNTYTKIEITFDDMEDALKYITPGERLFVRIYFK
ncbi:MAG: efflux RND transporter periplasmic adaptor subunit [Candidatus Cloacimonetes bacterium]|nr:efflux RND transporter periplasmic adaptor subunit [Candidatus Cloacimonadota bacterium]MCF7814736.1 efflux RND transporter periplasmic adaptor subunit [Candidatus Cloacimonadota bacterium]MCF7868004.1 efflux RND transporter periplasmic adaptor subunit [Candidatus Cloacimonadota bacterium]MCF7883462.1 efflux RND transporter periplasmic adaptor subunit [Candidatus Cloacimonadota bacterium]